MNRLAAAALALGLLACRPPEERELRTLKVTSPPLDPGPVLLDVDMPGGQLEVFGGGVAVLGGTLRYDHPDMKPRFAVSPADDGSICTLTADWEPGIGPTTNLWTLTLPPDRPFDLDLRMGGGRLNVAPRGATVRSLDAQLNFGEVLLDLSETDWDGTLEAAVEVGTGPRVRVVVPDDAGVRMRAIHSIGTIDAPALKEQDDETWVGAGYGERARTLELMVRVGSGDVIVRTAKEMRARGTDEGG